MGIYRAIHGKQPPRRPAQLSDPEERAEMMWSLLLKCWDHDPVARPDAATILELLKFERPPANPWLPILEAVQIGADIPTMPPPTTSQLIKFFEWLFHA
ncbi:hypothetical protein BDV93DRAFT_162602 [Ceratobasidium sp. AG-I]|nr:hypothetical protein BDV93DRAFT_162602 [Ceratobasidium sp. AG-I]